MGKKNDDLDTKSLVYKDSPGFMDILEQAEDSSIDNFLDSIKMIVGKDALQDTVRWLLGEADTPPKSIRLMSSNIAEKIELFNILLMLQNLERSSKIIRFMSEAEEMMFDRQAIAVLNTPELLKVYESAQKSLNSIMDHTRKFMNKNRAIAAQSEDMAKIVDMLLSLPPEKYERLRQYLQEAPSVELTEDD